MHSIAAGDNIKLIRHYHAMMVKYYSNFQTQVVLGILLWNTSKIAENFAQRSPNGVGLVDLLRSLQNPAILCNPW